MCQKRSLGNMCKSGSSLIENYVGEHQILTRLPFRPNAMSYGYLPQRQKGLTLSPLRLVIAGMTLSGQTNSTTLNILLGVRRSDLPLPFPPSPPTFFQVCCLCFFALFRWAPQHFLLPLAAVVWGPFCFGGVLPSWPPYLHVLFVCGPTWVMLSLPSFVLSLTFRSRLGFAFLGSWLCQSGASACVFFGASLSLSRSSPCLVGPRCFCLVFLAVVGPPPCQMLLPFPPRLVPCGALAQFVRWSLPLGVWLRQ